MLRRIWKRRLNNCHSCDNTKTWLLIWTGIVALAGILLLLVILAVVFLIGGIGAVESMCKPLARNVLVSTQASKVWSVLQKRAKERQYHNVRARKVFANDLIAPEFEFTRENQHFYSNCDTAHRSEEPPQTRARPDDASRASVLPFSPVAGTRIGVVRSPSDVPA